MRPEQRFDREQCLRLVADAYKNSVTASLDEYRDTLRDWSIRGYGRDTLQMVVLTKGPEIHTAFGPSRFWCRPYVRDAIQSLIQQYGHALTSVRRENERGQRFVTRIGFKRTMADERHIYYRMERLSDAFIA